MGCAAPARRAKLDGKIGNPGQRRVGVMPQERLDHRDDMVAMRDQPARQRVDEPSEERRTPDRRRDAQEDRAAEDVGEAVDGHAGQPVVETLHRRHGRNGAENRREHKREPLAPREPRLRHAMAVSRRQLAANAQAAQGEGERENERDAAGEIARRMRDVVVGVVREGKVADHVDQNVRRRGRGRNGARCQRKGRSQSQTHGRLALLEPRSPASRRTALARLAARTRWE